jgi:hypothetical protein
VENPGDQEKEGKEPALHVYYVSAKQLLLDYNTTFLTIWNNVNNIK